MTALPVLSRTPAEVETIDGRLLLTAQQAADTLGISKRAFYNWVGAGKLPQPVALSPRCKRWRVSDLLRCLDRLGGF